MALDGSDAPFGVDERMPPHDEDAERATLSAVLFDTKTLDKVNTFLRPEHFYSEAHRRIYEAVADLRREGQPVDVVQVSTRLRDRDRLSQVGGMAYLTDVLNAAPELAHAEAYARTVFACWQARQIGFFSQKATAMVRAGSEPCAVITTMQRDLETLEAPKTTARPPTLWAAELAAPLPPRVMVSNGLTIARGRPNVFAGEGGTRKGWLALAMQVCGAAGLPLLGRFDLKSDLQSVYLDYEQTEYVTRERLQLLCRGYGIDLASLGGRIGYRWQPILSLAPKTDLDRQKVIDQLCWHTEGIDLAVVDSVRACSPGVEENGVHASVPLDISTAVSEKTGAAFLFLDHAGKPVDVSTTGRKRKHAQRGHSSKRDAAQTLFVFSADKGEPTLVTCERSQVAAEDLWPKDFRFTLASTNGGLVLQEDVSRGQQQRTPDEELERLCKAFLKALRPNPGATSEEITSRMGVRAAAARAARDALERQGRIVNRGTKTAPKWWPVEAMNV